MKGKLIVLANEQAARTAALRASIFETAMSVARTGKSKKVTFGDETGGFVTIRIQKVQAQSKTKEEIARKSE